MESSSMILFAGALGVTSLLVAILYFLYKFLMRETPYQRTFLIEEVDSKHNSNDKKIAKKTKNAVRQRIMYKSLEISDKVSKDVGAGHEKAALNVDPVSEVKISLLSGVNLGNAPHLINQNDKTEPKKKPAAAVEKDVGAKSAKKHMEEVDEDIDIKQALSGKTSTNKDERVKARAPEPSMCDTEQKDKREEKKVQNKQTKEVVPSKPVKELPKQVKEHDDVPDQNSSLQIEKKKRTKRANEDIASGSMEQKVKHETVFPVTSQNKVEEVVKQKATVALDSAPPVQQQVPISINNKKKNPKVKAVDESDVADNPAVIHSELKQKGAPMFNNVEVLHAAAPVNSNKQQQLNVNKASSDLEGLKRMVSERDAVIQRDQMQLKTLNEALYQMKKELATERGRSTELEGSLNAITKKHTEEKQQLLSSLHQKDQQNKQTIQLLNQELQAVKSRPNDLSIIMSNLAEENAKLKSEISRAEKQVAEEMTQRSKTVELFNETLRKLEHSEMNNNAMELKFREAEERIRSLELKQKDKAHLEKMFYDLQQEHQHLKMQSQPNVELQNQLRAAKVENEEIQSVVDQLKTRITDLENELVAVKDASLIKESIQQQALNEQAMNGYADATLLANVEAKLSEQEQNNRELLEKLTAVDKNNRMLESERGELLVALEKLKRQVVDLEKELENMKTPPPPPLELVVMEQNVEELNQVLNGCDNSEIVAKLEACLAEKEGECKTLLERLEAKDKKNEDLRQKNWKTVEALTESEKRLQSMEREHELLLKGLKDEVEDLKMRLLEKEKKPLQVETVSVQQAAPLARSREASESDKAKANNVCNENLETENVKQLKMVARANQICINKQEEDIKTLMQELNEQRAKNDKLREKNWTIVTSLNDSEKKIQELYKELEEVKGDLREAKASLSSSVHKVHSPCKSSNEEMDVTRREYTIVNEVRESCQWDMSQLVLDLDTKAAELEILQAILDQHESSIKKLEEENKELKKKFSENEAAKKVSDLEQKVEHYKGVLVDTESILRTLEASVNAEENKWKSKAEKLEKEVTALRQKTQ